MSVDETQLKILQLRKRFKTTVVDELTEAQEDLMILSSNTGGRGSSCATIRAPVMSTVMAVKPNTVGAVVSPVRL